MNHSSQCADPVNKLAVSRITTGLLINTEVLLGFLRVYDMLESYISYRILAHKDSRFLCEHAAFQGSQGIYYRFVVTCFSSLNVSHFKLHFKKEFWTRFNTII